MHVTIFDYGAGNMHSLVKALSGPDVDVRIEPDPTRLTETDALVLPGVGAFGIAAARLAPARERVRAALETGLPCLGICLGMQLLFDDSEEGTGCGLALVRGSVRRLSAHRVPQMGWNTLDTRSDPLLDVSGLQAAYFANGFVCRPANAEIVRAWSTHEGDRFPSMIRVGRTVGVQFHPEKSSRAGVAFARAFLEEVRA
ncbi:MAG TPA: imidazole glycerol phosphate synthase subunit HisH [Gemmatimonadaceae bacterium]